MFRVGIIGTENSHAMAFARYFNLPDLKTGRLPHQDVRVVGVLNDSPRAVQIAKESGVDFIAERPEDFLGRVDAMMITSRRGSLHAAYAMPFVERSMPLFIDKPFTSDPLEADRLAAALTAHRCPVLGGSGCKYAVDSPRRLVAKLRASGRFLGASLNFSVALDSEYDGVYFYAPHLVEMALEIFGSDIQSLYAVRRGENMLTVLEYPRDAVSLHFTSTASISSCTIFSDDRNDYQEIDISHIHEEEGRRFAALLHGKETGLEASQLAWPVHVIDAIVRSCARGQRVLLRSLSHVESCL